LIDTNVFISAWEKNDPLHAWAVQALKESIAASACVSPVVVAELCAWKGKTAETVMRDIARLGISFVDLPVSSAGVCGEAYYVYLKRRKAETGRDGPRTPLPDFFYRRSCGGFRLRACDCG
jgi:predicted nucleic acid-binding protein